MKVLLMKRPTIATRLLCAFLVLVPYRVRAKRRWWKAVPHRCSAYSASHQTAKEEQRCTIGRSHTRVAGPSAQAREHTDVVIVGVR